MYVTLIESMHDMYNTACNCNYFIGSLTGSQLQSRQNTTDSESTDTTTSVSTYDHLSNSAYGLKTNQAYATSHIAMNENTAYGVTFNADQDNEEFIMTFANVAYYSVPQRDSHIYSTVY